MWYLAISQMLARKRQTLFVVSGVLLGTAAYVIFSGIMLGSQAFMINRLINNTGHIHISSREEEIEARSLDEELFGSNTLVTWKKPPSGRRDYNKILHPEGWFQTLRDDVRVAGYSPKLSIQALARRGTLSAAVNMIGVDPSRQEMVTNINEYIENNGKLSDIGRSGNRIIVGREFLNKLGASIGENIKISLADGPTFSFKIINTFDTGVRQADQGMIYAALADVQKVNRTPSRISDITVKLVDVDRASEVATSLSQIAVDKVESWDQENQGFLSIFNMQTIIRNLVTICIVLVAGFGIYNILNMIVSQKKKEIGILRSIGYTARDVSNLFLFQGIIFGLIGGGLGLVVSHIACRYIETIQVGGGRMGMHTMLVSYDWVIYVKAFLLAFGSSMLAGWIPARAAGRLDPIDIIRAGSE